MENLQYYDEHNNIIDHNTIENLEQLLVNKYVLPLNVVLELGARYGTVSCVINKKLIDKNNQVSVEPDERVWDALEKNILRNNCKINIVKGFISNEKLNLTNHEDYGGYGTTSLVDPSSTIDFYTLEQIQHTYTLKFDTLVADCEGYLGKFLDEHTFLYDQLNMIIFEDDYPEKTNYDKVRYNLRNKGFIEIERILNQNVWKKFSSSQ
jgi:FkbM family methyltransferase